MAPKSILFQPTESKDYALKRKAISSAFFKKKLALIAEYAKDHTLELLRETRSDDEIDIFKFTTEL